MLNKIGEVEICGETFHVAKNGDYHLVVKTGKDAYGTDVYQVFDLLKAEKEGELFSLCKDLIQEVGKLLSEKQAVADSRRAKLQGSTTIDG